MGRSSNDSMKLSNKKNRESLIIPLFTLTSPPLCVPLSSRRPWQLQGTYSPWIAKYLSFYKMKSSTLANVILSTRNTSLSVTERVRVRTERSISPNPGTCKKASNKGICQLRNSTEDRSTCPFVYLPLGKQGNLLGLKDLCLKANRLGQGEQIFCSPTQRRVILSQLCHFPEYLFPISIHSKLFIQHT